MNIEIKEGIWKHSKTGNEYRVLGVGKHSETLEDVVVYEALYNNPKSRLWVRPASMFIDIVDIKGERVPRFVFIREE